MSTPQEESRSGLLYGLGCYALWGIVPLYFKALRAVPALELLAHRVVWSILFLALLLSAGRRWRDLGRCLARPRLLALLSTSACLVACNWFVFIYGVASDQVLQASLGYFINPLVSVLLGLVFFQERLRPWQWLALALASAGLVYLILSVGQLPWIALALALTFGLYGLVRKITPVDGLLGLAVETLVLLPVAAGYLVLLVLRGEARFLAGGAGDAWLVAASGVITAVPLILFGQAARRLPLSTLGFLQYVAPSLQLLVAVLVFHEDFLSHHQVSFGCIWAGLVLFSLDSLRAQRYADPVPVPAPRRRAGQPARRVWSDEEAMEKG